MQNRTMERAVYLVDEYLRDYENFSNFEPMFEAKRDLLENSLQNITPDEINNRLENWYNSQSISIEVYRELNFLFSSLYNLQSIQNESLVKAKIQNIKGIENKVSRSSLYNENEKKLILLGTAVAKYSLVYWHKESNNPYSPWGWDQRVPWYAVDTAGALTGFQMSASAFGLLGIAGCAALGSALNEL
jgi:hypothetical protein